MLRARLENQNSRPLWNSSDAKIATRTVGTAAIAVNKRDQPDVQSSTAEPALLRSADRDLARVERHQRDRRQQDRDQQQRDQRRRQQRARLGAAAKQPDAQADHADQEQPQAAPRRGRRIARSPAPAGASSAAGR